MSEKTFIFIKRTIGTGFKSLVESLRRSTVYNSWPSSEKNRKMLDGSLAHLRGNVTIISMYFET